MTHRFSKFSPKKIFSVLRQVKIPIIVKLFCSFLILVVPVFLLTLHIIEVAKSEVKSQITNSKIEQVHFYMMSLEDEIQRIMSLQKQYMNDHDLQKLSSLGSNLSEYERTEIINRIYQKLDVLKNSSAYIEGIEVKIPSINRSISPTKYINDYQMDDYSIGNSNGVMIRDGELFINMSYSPSIYTPLYIIEIQLSIEYLQQSLNQFTVNGGAILFHPDLQISTSENNPISKKLVHTFTENKSSPEEKLSLSSMELNDKNYWIINGQSTLLNASLVVYLLEDSMVGTMNEYRVFFWLLCGTTIFITLLFSYIIYLFIHKPIKTLVHSFKKVEKGEFDFKINSIFNDEFNYIYNGFNRMTTNLKRLIHETYIQKLHLYQAELRQLQAQINPHFLYNSFFILHRMIKYKHEEAATFSKHLGHYFKYITRNANQEVTLEEEYQHMMSYLEIQQVRFSNRLEVSIGPLDETFKPIKVPRLILQPIVENAFEHGLKDKVSNAKLSIYCTMQMNRFSICIEDNGDITEERVKELSSSLTSDQRETTGLLNVHRRLQMNFGDDSGITFARGQYHGLKVMINIPLKGEMDNV
ncbi:histidine kinase [Gracilibacillus sp. YIM 98692]|uniref:sensor histidine kinase n=1 Tax=Gracilibacillus sp. YIM 98692 TaxID=2663532 RepID=UPI0013D69C5B|nr:histidine kinase [Gracilibacillus sp. YIM 98692]